MHPVIERQLAQLQDAGWEAQAKELPSGAVLITVSNVPLPEGWSRDQTDVRFVAPAGYPFGAPDCFWCDQGLQLANGLPPQSTNYQQPIPETGEQGTWFSWHVTHWNPNIDSLLSFFRLARQRLQMVK